MNGKNQVLANRLQVIRERVNALKDDNYQVVVQSYNVILVFVRLRHRTNGNNIVIKAQLANNAIRQWTNGKLVHDGLIIPV